MKKMLKKTTMTILIMGVFSTINIAHAQNNSGGQVNTQVATSIVLPPDYTDTQLRGAGCDRAVWTQMVADYTSKARTNLEVGNQIQVLNQARGAPSQMASCFDAAANIINNATRAYNAIVAILTGGGMDSGALYAYAERIVVGAACSQINSYINQSGVGTSIGTVNGTIGTVLNTSGNIGGVNTGSIGTVINQGGYQQNTSNNLPSVTGSDIANQTGATGTLDSINPFK